VAVGPPSTPRPNPNTVAVPAAGTCHSVGGLPDPTCTPGLLNADLTVAQLCAAGFSTKTVRPPTSYTDALKPRLMASYGIAVEDRVINGVKYSTEDFYELDHVVALEDLGHPWSPLNLWPQPRGKTVAMRDKPSVPTGLDGPWAEQKDRVETRANATLCANPSRPDEAALLAQLDAQLAHAWPTLLPSSIAADIDIDTGPTKEPEP
jgi:hypothetical protein